MNGPKPSSGQPAGVRLFDTEGRRLYLTKEERRAFVLAAAAKAPHKVLGCRGRHGVASSVGRPGTAPPLGHLHKRPEPRQHLAQVAPGVP